VRLTEDQIREFNEQGFIVIPGVLSEEEIERYKHRAREIALGDLPPGGEKMVVKDVRVAKGEIKPDDPEKGIWKLLQPDWYDPIFEPYPRDAKLLDVIECLIGPDIKAFLTMMIYKPPGLESAVHPYHQDSAYFNFGPHDLIVGSWIALDPTDEDNGTLTVIPGSHKFDLVPHELQEGEKVNFGLFEAEGFTAGHPDEVSLKMNPGDGAFFHSRLLHRTGPNLTDRHRRVLTVHLASAKCEVYGEILGQMKMRLVRGQEYAGCV
jgi:phytanoyl-CoA hydroxylase